MWIEVPAITGSETINFDLVKEIYVDGKTVSIVQINDEDDINNFEQVNCKNANEVYKQLKKHLNVKEIIGIKLTKDINDDVVVPTVSIRKYEPNV